MGDHPLWCVEHVAVSHVIRHGHSGGATGVASSPAGLGNRIGVMYRGVWSRCRLGTCTRVHTSMPHSGEGRVGLGAPPSSVPNSRRCGFRCIGSFCGGGVSWGSSGSSSGSQPSHPISGSSSESPSSGSSCPGAAIGGAPHPPDGLLWRCLVSQCVMVCGASSRTLPTFQLDQAKMGLLALDQLWRHHFCAHPNIPFTIKRQYGHTSKCSVACDPREHAVMLVTPLVFWFGLHPRDIGRRIPSIPKIYAVPTLPPHPRVFF